MGGCASFENPQEHEIHSQQGSAARSLTSGCKVLTSLCNLRSLAGPFPLLCAFFQELPAQECAVPYPGNKIKASRPPVPRVDLNMWTLIRAYWVVSRLSRNFSSPSLRFWPESSVCPSPAAHCEHSPLYLHPKPCRGLHPSSDFTPITPQSWWKKHCWVLFRSKKSLQAQKVQVNSQSFRTLEGSRCESVHACVHVIKKGLISIAGYNNPEQVLSCFHRTITTRCLFPNTLSTVRHSFCIIPHTIPTKRGTHPTHTPPHARTLSLSHPPWCLSLSSPCLAQFSVFFPGFLVLSSSSCPKEPSQHPSAFWKSLPSQWKVIFLFFVLLSICV